MEASWPSDVSARPDDTTPVVAGSSRDRLQAAACRYGTVATLAPRSRTRVGVTVVVVAPVAALANYRPVVSSFCQPFGVSPLDPVNQTAAQTTDRWNVLRQQQHSQRQHPEANNRQKPQEAAAEKQQGDRYPHPSGRWLAQPSDPARKRRWQLADERLNTRIVKHLLSMTLNRRSGEFARLLNELRFHADRAQAFFGQYGLRQRRLQRLFVPPNGQATPNITHMPMHIFMTEDEHPELRQMRAGVGYMMGGIIVSCWGITTTRNGSTPRRH
jgi:hypothetical protein